MSAPIPDAERLSSLLFVAREYISMWAETVEERTGKPAVDVRGVIDDLDTYRIEHGLWEHGFGADGIDT
ncbi:MAG TPA: hypothetical protein VK537_07585 [Galbitalea sp.]|nr:hypothetical protein [Galbitalea sp.]